MTFNNETTSSHPSVEDNEATIEDTEEGNEEHIDREEVDSKVLQTENSKICKDSDADTIVKHRTVNINAIQENQTQQIICKNETKLQADNQNPFQQGGKRIRRKSSFLLSIAQVPTHLRFNKYVYSYYRPPMDILGCIFSLTYWHNETVNILTHFFPVIFITSIIPWMLPWSQIQVPWLPWTHVAACLAPWIGSTLYHLFMCHQSGKFAYLVLLKVDLLGIWFTQTLGALVTICAAIHCFDYETKALLLLLYLAVCVLCLYQAMTVSTVWGRRFAFTAPFIIRVFCLVLRLSPYGGGAPNTTRHVILQDLLAILGGYIGAVNIPEKWFPGKLDLVFNSHHIMHVLVVAAVYHMHMAAEMDLLWMSSSEACQSSLLTQTTQM